MSGGSAVPRIHGFNVESEFLSLFLHGFKTAESRDSLQLIVANVQLRKPPWVAMFCKTPPNPLDKEVTRAHEQEKFKVLECLQGVHGCKSQADCQWALQPPSDVNGFVSGRVSGKTWAIARWGATSDVREVEKQRLNAVLFEEAQDKYTQVAGELAADTLRIAHKHQNRGQGVTKAQYVEATMAFMEKENTFVKMYIQWLDRAANLNIHLENGSKQVCRLKQACTPTGAARKYLTAITDAFLRNYAVSLDEARDGTKKNTQGVWPCRFPIDSLPLQQLSSSPALMSCLSKQSRCWVLTAVGDTVPKKRNTHKYTLDV